MVNESGGTLYVIATPIGNMEDVTYRAVRILGQVDVLACEDTRLTRKILSRYEIPSPTTVISYHEHNEEKAGERILSFLENGKTVGLCSDAGYPGVSDPGYRIIAEARHREIRVEVVPGSGAVTTALVSSGLPTSSFTFLGFPPRKRGPRRRFLEHEAAAHHTLVVFESPHRIGALLSDAAAVLGDRQAAVCVEMTKKFEEIHRGFLSDLIQRFEDRSLRGEITVVIAGNHPKFQRPGPDNGNGGYEDG